MKYKKCPTCDMSDWAKYTLPASMSCRHEPLALLRCRICGFEDAEGRLVREDDG